MRYGIYFSMAAMLILSSSCQGSPKEPSERPEPIKGETTEASSQRPSPDASSSLAQYADAVLSIGNLLKATLLSWPDIEEKYAVARTHIEEIDSLHLTSYAQEISKALAGIRAGESAEVNNHIVTKGLQHVTVLIIQGLLDKLVTADLEDAKGLSADIKTAYAAIEPTFKRRDDTVYAGNPTLAPAAEAALARLESAQSKTALASGVMEFSTLLSKTYALSILFEMKGVEEYCGSKAPNPAQCAVKRTEAAIYYRILQPAVAKKDKEAAAAIDKMIHSEHAVDRYTSVRDHLAKTLPFTIKDLTF
jgi:hypothetical protein